MPKAGEILPEEQGLLSGSSGGLGDENVILDMLSLFGADVKPIQVARLSRLMYLVEHLRATPGAGSWIVGPSAVWSDVFHATLSHMFFVGKIDLLVEASYVFITDASGAGTITSKTYLADTSPADKILTSFESDNSDITLTLEIHTHTDAWQPDSVTVTAPSATPVTVLKQDWTQAGSSRTWTATANLTDAGTSGTITATLAGGDTATCAYTRVLDPPLVTSAVFDDHPLSTGGDAKCPYLQTQVKSGDTVRITGTTEAHATHVYVKDAGVSSALQGPFTVTASAFDLTANVGSRASATQTATLYAVNGVGSTPGADYPTDNTIDQDQTSPTFSGPSYDYPVTQEAIKASESCDVTITHTNAASGDTYSYDTNGTGELTIPATTTYAATKSASYLSGTYRESGTNYRLTATRTEKNGKSATVNATVKIAAVAPTVTVGKNSGGTALDRMGSDDGTLNYLDSTIYLISTQANLSTHTPSLIVAAGHGGTPPQWQGSWSAGTNLYYSRALRIKDADIVAGGQTPNNWAWDSCSIKNRAGMEAVVVGTNPSYALGGFQTRTLNMGPITGGDPPYTHTADIGVPVVDTSKVTAVNISKGGTPTQAYEGNVTEHNDADSSLNNYWTTVNALAGESFDDYTQYFHCSDKKFYDSVTAPGGFNVTVVESA